VSADDPATAVSRIIELAKTRIPKRFGLDPIRDIQVLCPMNRGGVGARSLNIELQAVLNPAGDRKVERFGWTFAPGDKVMQIENDYDKEVYNGDIGTIDDVDPDAGELAVSFDGRSIKYGFGELDTLVPAYAATIHKSQGSEYPAVIIPVLTQHYACCSGISSTPALPEGGGRTWTAQKTGKHMGSNSEQILAPSCLPDSEGSSVLLRSCKSYATSCNLMLGQFRILRI